MPAGSMRPNIADLRVVPTEKVSLGVQIPSVNFTNQALKRHF